MYYLLLQAGSILKLTKMFDGRPLFCKFSHDYSDHEGLGFFAPKYHPKTSLISKRVVVPFTTHTYTRTHAHTFSSSKPPVPTQ